MFDRLQFPDEVWGLVDHFFIIPSIGEPFEDWAEEVIPGVVAIGLFLERVCIFGDQEGWGGRGDGE